jgi:polyribonucleotide nucleotidyltransferase
MNKEKKFDVDFAGKKLELSTGKLAQLADGSIEARYGDTVVLACVCVAPEPNPDIDYFPLFVDYEEKFYAAGKISGSRFIKREGRPSDAAVLTARLIDRPLRPLFPKEYRNDIQVIVTVLSVDKKNDPDIISIIAASTALMQSPTPFKGPVGAVRVCLIGDKFEVNPDADKAEKSELDLIIAGTEDRAMMIEARANEVPEDKVLEAIKIGQKALKPIIDVQRKIAELGGKNKAEFIIDESDIHVKISDEYGAKLRKAVAEINKEKRTEELAKFEAQILAAYEGDHKQIEIKNAFDAAIEKEVRRAILEEEKRPDGRKLDEVRPIGIEVKLLARIHGSALFTRGETQVLSIVTLDTPSKEQMIDTMGEEGTRNFMHHYNFPPFSTGEVAPLRGASRREIGHGALAEKALAYVVPTKEEFPYTIRVVSEVLSSNGSSSMASVCGMSLSLMDAGVPIKKPVSGVAMGLITGTKRDKEIKEYKILTDIQGLEDFAGDMDFKVAGTDEGITAIQLDVKIPGITEKIFKESFEQAKKARLEIMEKMKAVLPAPREKLSEYAPVIEVIKINKDKIRDVIGPGGRVINAIIDKTGVDIDIEDDGTVMVSSKEGTDLQGAVKWIKDLTHEVAVGEVFQGKITRIMNFGAFAEVLPGQEGLIHISQLSDRHVKKVEDVVKIGDIVSVMVIEIDEQGRINLSMKAAAGGGKEKR